MKDCYIKEADWRYKNYHAGLCYIFMSPTFKKNKERKKEKRKRKKKKEKVLFHREKLNFWSKVVKIFQSL